MERQAEGRVCTETKAGRCGLLMKGLGGAEPCVAGAQGGFGGRWSCNTGLESGCEWPNARAFEFSPESGEQLQTMMAGTISVIWKEHLCQVKCW